MTLLEKSIAWGLGVAALSFLYMYVWAHTMDIFSEYPQFMDIFPEYPRLAPAIAEIAKLLGWDDGSPEMAEFNYRLFVAFGTVTSVTVAGVFLRRLFRNLLLWKRHG